MRHVHKLAEDHKVGVREARRDALGLLKDLMSEGLSEDDKRREDKKIQALTDDYVKQFDQQYPTVSGWADSRSVTECLPLRRISQSNRYPVLADNMRTGFYSNSGFPRVLVPA